MIGYCLLIFRFAGNKVVIRDVADRFGVAESTCHKNIELVINFINSIASTVIKFPKTQQDKLRISEEFEQVNFIYIL